ncbi:MAG: glycerol dehydrogenase [Clostridiales Family XIII bacterium]|jgi:glycerol dehydrogenase|nr:glycerol dehydrogenase [Clostridiales Family XIII bacterium]
MSQRRTLVLPGRIVLGRGALGELGGYAAMYGGRALLIAHAEDRARVKGVLDETAKRFGVEFAEADFPGECCESAVAALKKQCLDLDAGLVIGLGGGKGIDTAKIIADHLDLPMFSVPTIAATDAPCSSLAIMYDDEHRFVGPRQLRRNPALVLIDTEIIAQAPERFLVSGMGDAFPTFFEARACRRANAQSNGGLSTLCAYSLARLCLDTLLEKGEEALIACRNGIVTPAFEDIVEVNIVMSGIGFESVGVAAAHGLAGSLEFLGATRAMHGEIVAFGALAQFVLEDAPREEIRAAIDFYRRVGLPLRLSDLGIGNPAPEALDQAAELACAPGSVVHNMPFDVTPGMIRSSIVAADRLADIF